jgi:YidC/Oxa1 family membrane protein insertase
MQPQQPNGPDSRNLVIALILASAVMAGWHFLYEAPRLEALRAEQAAKEASIPTDTAAIALPDDVAPATSAEAPAQGRPASPRVRIESDRLTGSIRLDGARMDDLVLRDYKTSQGEDAQNVRLLAHDGMAHDPYFAEFGLLSADRGVDMPTATTRWQADGTVLSPDTPVTLRWENAQGLIFEKHFTLDAHYMFTVTMSVRDPSGNMHRFFPYGLINRTTNDDGEHFYILHEGPIGVFNDALEEHSYEALRDDGKESFTTEKGWLGISDKYWLTAMVPATNGLEASMRHLIRKGRDAYQVDMRGAAIETAGTAPASASIRFYAGAKKVTLLDEYAALLDIPLFDRAVDFGSLYFLTKPIFKVLNFFHGIVGNFGVAILLLTICIKLLLFPLANKSYRSMSQMRLLMPKMKELQARHKEDRMALNMAMMELYKKEKVNPASGCFPIFLQIPVFFALYKVLFVTIEMRHAPFFGWITDLSAPDPTSLFNLFGLLPYSVPDFLMIGIWPCIMCLTMVLQQRLNPKPTDPIQATMITWMPYVFLFIFASFPAGLVVYWAWNNTLSVIQQWVIMKRLEAQQSNKKRR